MKSIRLLILLLIVMILITGCNSKLNQKDLIKASENAKMQGNDYCSSHGMIFLNQYSHDGVNWFYTCYYESPTTFKEYPVS